MLTKEYLHELFEYREGALHWKISRSSRVKVGDRAGTISKGYVVISIDGRGYSEHRLVYMMFHGEVPLGLDHIDTKPMNNRIENLRPANQSQNGFNHKLSKNNTSGVKGVSWCSIYSKWVAYIWVNRKKIHVGYFIELEEAKKAVEAAREKYHGEFANHG